MNNLVQLRHLLLAVLTLNSLSLCARNIVTEVFTPAEICQSWFLMKDGADIVQWGEVVDNGICLNVNNQSYNATVKSSAHFYDISRIDVEFSTNYDRFSITDAEVVYGDEISYFNTDSEIAAEGRFSLVPSDADIAYGAVNISFQVSRNSDLYLKSIAVTYDKDGGDRNLRWSDDELAVYLGQSFEMPQLLGVTDGVVFASSNHSAAVIAENGQVTPVGEGETVITASCPAAGPWRAAEASFKMVVNFNYTGSGTDEVVTLSAPGTLRDKVLELESTKIRSIRVNGPINSKDIAYLRETTGRFIDLQGIDLTDATVSPDGGSYAVMRGDNHDVGMGYDRYVFILSDECRIEEDSSPTGLGGGVHTYTYYYDNLAGAFNNLTNLRRLCLPGGLDIIPPFVAAGCTELVELAVPADYTEIGQGACSGCSQLASIPVSPSCVKVGDSVFSYSGLSVFDFESVEEIGKDAFAKTRLSGCLMLPKVVTVGDYGFSNCKAIDGVVFGEDLNSVGECAFRYTGISGRLVIPAACTHIGAEAFYDTEIREIELPESCLDVCSSSFSSTPWYDEAMANLGADEVLYLGHLAYAFKTDYALHMSDDWSMTLAFRAGTTTVANNFARYFVEAYYGDGKIVELSLPDSMCRIGDEAFKDLLSKVETIAIPDNVTYIGASAFHGCGVNTLTLSSNIKMMGEYAFAASNGLVRLSYNVPNAEHNVFSYCQGLESVTFGRAVEALPDYAFASCPALRKIDFDYLKTPEVAKAPAARRGSFKIGEGVFLSCSSLSTITLPPSLSEVGKSAFTGTTPVTVYCHLIQPIDVSSSELLSNGKRTTVYVPAESESVYKADTQWGRCNIVGAEMDSVDEAVIDTDESVLVYNPAGVLVYSGAIGGMNLPSGTYIVKSHSRTVKIRL